MILKMHKYVTSQSNDVSNVSNVSNVSLLDILLQPDVTIKRLDIKNVSKPSKNTNEDDLAKYHLLKAASLGDADIEVWQCCMFWEYIFVRALEDDIDRITRATDGKMRRIRGRSNSNRRGSWSVTTKDEMKVGQVGSERRRRRKSSGINGGTPRLINACRSTSPVVFSFDNIDRKNILRSSSGGSPASESESSEKSSLASVSRPESPRNSIGGDGSTNNDEWAPNSVGWTTNSTKRLTPPTLPPLSNKMTKASTSAPSTPVAISSSLSSATQFEVSNEDNRSKSNNTENIESVCTPSSFHNKKAKSLLTPLTISPLIDTPSYLQDFSPRSSSGDLPSSDLSETKILSPKEEEEEEETNCTYIKGIDDTILREAVYEEMMDLVLIMLKVGVGADSTHSFVHWVFAAYGMTTEEEKVLQSNFKGAIIDIPSGIPSNIPSGSAGTASDAATSINKLKVSKWLSTLDTLVENVAKARDVEKQFLYGGMDAFMAMAEMMEEIDESNHASPVRLVNRSSLLRGSQNHSKKIKNGMMRRITELNRGKKSKHNDWRDFPVNDEDGKDEKKESHDKGRDRAPSSRRLSMMNFSKKKNIDEDNKKEEKKHTVQERGRPLFFDLDRVVGRTLETDGSTDRVAVSLYIYINHISVS